MDYDYAIRERVAESMTNGTDIAKAFDDAMADMSLRQTAFLCNFTTEIGSARCRALTAPAFHDIHGAATPARPQKRLLALEDGSVESPPSKAAKRRARAAAKIKAGGGALKKARTQLQQAQAALNKANAATASAPTAGAGGTQSGTGGAPRSTGGKGTGKGKSKTADGKAICYAYNNGNACRNTPCPYVHVCQACGGNHPKTAPECPKFNSAKGA